MYQVATDYPKQMANIMSEYEARAKDPRYNAFGESPDSPRRLEQELVEPFHDVMTAQYPETRAQTLAATPRLFQTKGGVISVDPTTGQSSTVYSSQNAPTPQKSRKASHEENILVKEINALKKASLTREVMRPKNLTDAVIDERIADRTEKLNALLSEEVLPAPVVAPPSPTPRAAIGGSGTLLNEIQTTTPSPLQGSIQIGDWVGNAYANGGYAQPPAKASPAKSGYKAGSIYSGLKFLGGDPKDKKNWQSAR